jgi:hypothetical protein
VDTRSKSIDLAILASLCSQGGNLEKAERVEACVNRMTVIDLDLPLPFPLDKRYKSAVLFDALQLQQAHGRVISTILYAYVISPTLVDEIKRGFLARQFGRKGHGAMLRFTLGKVLYGSLPEYRVIHRTAAIATSVEELLPNERRRA